MGNKKYEFTGETINHYGRTLHRIRALIDFDDISAGDTGGWIEKEANLSQDGNARVSGNAMVLRDAWVDDEYDYITIGPIGSRGDRTTFFHTKSGTICVRCGCFSGTIDEFRDRVVVNQQPVEDKENKED